MQESKKKIDFKPYIISFVISFIIGSIIFCLYFFLNGMNISAACSATGLSFGFLILIGLLIWVTREGAFDTFAYGFIQLGSSMFRKGEQKYASMVEYKQSKQTLRSKKSNYFYSFIICGALFGVALLILEICYHVAIGK